MGKNELDAVTFSKLLDMFGVDAARDTLNDVKEGKISPSTIEKYLYMDETKEEYAQWLRDEYKDFE